MCINNKVDRIYDRKKFVNEFCKKCGLWHEMRKNDWTPEFCLKYECVMFKHFIKVKYNKEKDLVIIKH